MLGDTSLRNGQHGLEMANAKRPAREQVHDAETGLVAEAFIDSNHGHEGIFAQNKYSSIRIFAYTNVIW